MLPTTRRPVGAPPAGASGPGRHCPASVAWPVVVSAPPPAGDDWLGLIDDQLPLGVAVEWATLPSCGAVVTFTGTARDHSAGRPGVTRLEYEAYDEQVGPRLVRLAAALRRRWPSLGRLVVLHRTGPVELTEASVLVVVSSPHRPEAFAAARAAIDTLKASLPVWKREVWDGGDDWALDACAVGEPDDDGLVVVDPGTGTHGDAHSHDRRADVDRTDLGGAA